MTSRQVIFKDRIEKLYSHLKSSEFDAIATAFGSDSPIYSKSQALQIWLFGVDILSDTLFVFAPKIVYFIASSRKLDVLKGIVNFKNVDDSFLKFELLIKQKDNKTQFSSILEKISSCKKEANPQPILGSFLKEKCKSSLCESFLSDSKVTKCEIKDASNLMSLLLSLKDEDEIENLLQASLCTVNLYNKYVKESVISVIDEERKVTHIKLADKVENAAKNVKYVGNIDTQKLEVCYSPIIQSGGNYVLKYSCESNDTSLCFDVILCFLGLRFDNYCCNMVRTILVSPSDKISKNYQFLMDVQNLVMTSLIPDTSLSSVYNNVIKYVTENRPDLTKRLTPNFGSCIGIEFRDNGTSIGPNIKTLVKNGMVFNVSVGFNNLMNSETKKRYALMLADTCRIDDGKCILLTNQKKKLKNISVILQKHESGQDSDFHASDIESGITSEIKTRRGASVYPRPDLKKEQERIEEQKSLLDSVNSSAQQRYNKTAVNISNVQTIKNKVSYKNALMMPKPTEISNNRLFVDKKAETVFLPIFGTYYPVHISYLKTVTQSVEDKFTFLRINISSTTLTTDKELPEMLHYLKEITFKSSNKKEAGEISSPAANLNKTLRLIKEVQKATKERTIESKEMKGVIKQDDLIVDSTNTNIRIPGLFVKPSNLFPKRINGTLTCHKNGLQYKTIRGEKFDLLFNNVKHSFFQPCDHELIILLHFHLKSPIVINGKKISDIQFYMEVGESVTDLGRRPGSRADQDELNSEQAERIMRKKFKNTFKKFCSEVERVSDSKINFEIPIRDLGFYGVPLKSTVLLQPTTNCLIQVVEWPTTIISIEEIELVFFERVSFSIRNFDMVIVFKDYKRPVFSINSIASTHLQQIKQWLHELDILYGEGVHSLNWVKVMKAIVEDFDKFFENGGWSFLMPADTEGVDVSDDEEEDDENFKVSEDEIDGSISDSSENSCSGSNNYSDVSESGSGSVEGDSESGKDWDELEKEALNFDSKKENGQDVHKNSKHRRR